MTIRMIYTSTLIYCIYTFTSPLVGEVDAEHRVRGP
jgi:hypothetical protein